MEPGRAAGIMDLGEGGRLPTRVLEAIRVGSRDFALGVTGALRRELALGM